MRFPCRPVDLTFLDSAPYQIKNEVIINASPERIFEVFEDGDSWCKWVKAINKVEWTSPKPFGVGTTRTVNLNNVKAYEKLIVWDTGKRLAFYFAATSIPFARAFCEDYQLEPLDNGKIKIRHTVAFEPNNLSKVAGPIMKRIMRNMFRNALHSLADLLQSMENTE